MSRAPRDHENLRKLSRVLRLVIGEGIGRAKIVQGAVAEVLSAIYQADFLDCSFGFRPGRSDHQALRVVREAITTEPVN
jgi:retron-type reverse transcriptase